MTTFQIPEDLTPFTFSAIEKMKEQAQAEFSSIMATATPDTITDDELDDVQALQEFVRDTVPAHLADRKRRRDQFATLNTAPDPEGDEDGDNGDGGEDGDITDGVPTATAVTAGAVIDVKLSDIVSRQPGTVDDLVRDSRPRYSTLVAAAGVPNYEAGQQFPREEK